MRASILPVVPESVIWEGSQTMMPPKTPRKGALMKRITICTIGSLLALSALAAEPELDEEAQAVAAQRNQTREARMQWWRDARFGMFVHWGVYSVPAGTYRVALIYYSADDHGNTPFYVDVDGQRLTHRTRRKDSMDSSGITVDLGTVRSIWEPRPLRARRASRWPSGPARWTPANIANI